MIDDNKHYMNMSAIMLAQRNEQSRQEKKSEGEGTWKYAHGKG